MKTTATEPISEEGIKHVVSPMNYKDRKINTSNGFHRHRLTGSHNGEPGFSPKYIRAWIYTDQMYYDMDQKGQLALWDYIECRSVENSYWQDKTVPTLGSQDYFMQAWNTGVRHMFCTREGGCVGLNQLELWDHAECRSTENSYWEERTVPLLGSPEHDMEIWKSKVRHIFFSEEKGCIELEGTVGRLQDPLSTLQNSMETESRHFRNYLDLRQQKENAKLRRAMVKENN